jgi:hypothetical protein
MAEMASQKTPLRSSHKNLAQRFQGIMADAGGDDGGDKKDSRTLSSMSKSELAQLMHGMKLGADGKPLPKEHKFWDTQPVPKLGARVMCMCRGFFLYVTSSRYTTCISRRAGGCGC